MPEPSRAKMHLDERFDISIGRPVGRAAARWFHRMGMSADQVSLVAAVLGVSGGMFFIGDGLWPLFGGLLVLGMVIIDCADGEVARLNGPSDKPWRGRMIDGYADLLTLLSIHTGMMINLSSQPVAVGGYEVGWFEILLIVVAGWFSLTWKSSVLDDIKQRLKPNSVDRDLERYRDQDKTLFERFLFWSLVTYTRAAEKLTGDGRPGGYELFRQVAIIGPTHHIVAVAICALFAPLAPTMFLAYFAMTILPGNLYMWLMMARARRSPARMS